jgi:bacillopeptidase F (M6 metalloprotease family)
MDMTAPWRISNVRASTGSFSYHNGPDGALYAPDTCAELTTPALAIPAGATLAYDARYNLELNWDGVVVEISTDGGASWADLPPDGGYPATLSATGNPPINACGYAATQGAYTGSSNDAFLPKTTNLAAYAGSNVRIRWRFSSDPGAEEEGFYLDNVRILGGLDPDLVLRSGFEADDLGATTCN